MKCDRRQLLINTVFVGLAAASETCLPRVRARVDTDGFDDDLSDFFENKGPFVSLPKNFFRWQQPRMITVFNKIKTRVVTLGFDVPDMEIDSVAYVWNVDTTELTNVLTPIHEWGWISFAPDDGHISMKMCNGQLRVWDVEKPGPPLVASELGFSIVPNDDRHASLCMS